MDIRKERKAFEEYLISQGVDLKYIPSIHFNGCIYDQGDDFDEDQQEALGEINLGWNAWQAAKAQAVPEGFVLVSSRDLLDLTVMINQIDLLAIGKRPAEVSYHMVSVGTRIQEIIEAKEPTND